MASLLESLVQHIALPPKLPGAAEHNLDEIEAALVSRLIHACRLAGTVATGDLRHHFDTTRFVLQTCKSLNAGRSLKKESLAAEFSHLQTSRPLILHVTEQNAGVLIQKVKREIIFEVFEASAQSDKVLAAPNTLLRVFPASAVAFAEADFNRPSFQQSLASFLEQASSECIKEFSAHTNKAGSFTVESRETVDPALITEMLITILEAYGKRVNLSTISKRVRDDVCWAPGGRQPWRRSPLWLIVRVGLSRHLRATHGMTAGAIYYKILLCLLLHALINDTARHLHPEVMRLLSAKLARRLVKIQTAIEGTAAAARYTLDNVFQTLEPIFTRTLQVCNKRIELQWRQAKASMIRPITNLPARANDSHLRLGLPNSWTYLQRVLTWRPIFASTTSRSSMRSISNLKLPGGAAGQYRTFSIRVSELAALEASLDDMFESGPDGSQSPEGTCLAYADTIDGYLEQVKNEYKLDPEQMSGTILKVMSLWMLMDKSAVEAWPLLCEYNTGVDAESLDVLQLMERKDFVRLQQIQSYIQDRNDNAGNDTIFKHPSSGCYAERYFNESTDASKLSELYERIEGSAQRAKEGKRMEWQRLSAEYSNLQQQIASTECLYTVEDNRTVHDGKRCKKCYRKRCSKRMKIETHEHPLPADPVEAKVVVFEMAIPEAFARYRDTTWKIIGTLGAEGHKATKKPQLILREYRALMPYHDMSASSVSLASSTKPFLSTHYGQIRFPVGNFEDVYHPNGLNFAYYDSATGSWLGKKLQKPTFDHHCCIAIPSTSHFASLGILIGSKTQARGPTSYEIVASQTKCPSNLNCQEFTAFQQVFTGRYQRWLVVLVELGASNLNFSTEAVSSMISQLAAQAGPKHNAATHRAVHETLKDDLFCKQILNKIQTRMKNIAAHWREKNCMEMLLNLTLHVYALARDKSRDEAFTLILEIRSVTLDWIQKLRMEMKTSPEAKNMRRCSEHALWAALLCKRTFLPLTLGIRDTGTLLSVSDMAIFIECSITLQDSLSGDPRNASPYLRNSIVRDVKMVHRLRNILVKSLKTHPQSLAVVLNKLYTQADGEEPRQLSDLEFHEQPEACWIYSTIRSAANQREQELLFHLFDGQLLIDDQPVGRLPPEHQSSVILRELFGEQSLVTWSSPEPGMTYVLARTEYGHQIHIGFRHGQLIVRARFRKSWWELIPRDVFSKADKFDLPASLVSDCKHWLNLRTRELEIRQAPNIWKPKSSNWHLNLNTRLAVRRQSHLVDPQSAAFKRVARIFRSFEYPDRLTVYQPATNYLSVEIKRLELTFVVNKQGLLKCKELQTEIDPNQDAGTWYGLESGLVMRDPLNHRERSIIVPLGAVTYQKNDLHVSVNIDNDGTYARYTINDTLGRIECNVEPTFLYFKSLLHACTSFAIEDPLTGRTGTEEALHCLKSGQCSPWKPLQTRALQALRQIAKLTPKRNYYPSDMKAMQQTHWDPDLNTTIQNESFTSTINSILRKSNTLSRFYEGEQRNTAKVEDNTSNSYLLERATFRRNVYQRSNDDAAVTLADVAYAARGQDAGQQRRANVYEVVKYVLEKPTRLDVTQDLAGILQSWSKIQGYSKTLEPLVTSDLLRFDFASEWGTFANFCRSATDNDRLAFVFAPIAFNSSAPMEVIRTFVAYALFVSVKTIDPPAWPLYQNFRVDQAPSIAVLSKLVNQSRKPYTLGSEEAEASSTWDPEQWRLHELAKQKHEEQADNDCKTFAEFVLRQWPCPCPSLVQIHQLETLDMEKAMGCIRPEWLRLFQNWELSEYIGQVQSELDLHRGSTRPRAPEVSCLEEAEPDLYGSKATPVLLRRLMSKNLPAQPTISSDEGLRVQGTTDRKAIQSNLQVINELELAVKVIANSNSTVRQDYGRDLLRSISALNSHQASKASSLKYEAPVDLGSAIITTQRALKKHYAMISSLLEHGTTGVKWLKLGGLWPSTRPLALLEKLRTVAETSFGSGTKDMLIRYAEGTTRLQRLLRFDHARRHNNKQKIEEEEYNTGHTNWRPLERPDWILLEIDANLLIRADQVDVAMATISPASNSNSVLQMNMGQGKTSCILPMAAAYLADKKRLVRVVVPEALLLQTAQIIQTKLGGLVGREICHVPFSRRTPTKSDTIKTFHEIHTALKASAGVMISLPEHLMSFKLSGLQRLSDKMIVEATPMVKTQTWLDQTCRDILDECDFTLAVRTQLIYPSGAQTTIDGHPYRWEVSETMLMLVESHLDGLASRFPHSIEVFRRPQGGFPLIFFLRKDVEDVLLDLLVADIVDDRTSFLPTKEMSPHDRSAVQEFITAPVVKDSTVAQVHTLFAENLSAKNTTYLLRGLLVHRILLLALKKRWNVQYGLHPQRDPIAVPFHAKGIPSEHAEWGHPDVAVLFTCLAFYLGGLTLEQMHQSLDHLIKSDDPSNEYERWTQSSEKLPGSLRQCNVINLDDDVQVRELWQHLHYSVIVIDYFMNKFVFPRHAKQFSVKMQTSGWDLPLRQVSDPAKLVQPMTTGFSGTNDNRTLLPLNIEQKDLAGLSHTNAEVLGYLLEPRNRRYVLAADKRGKRLSEVDLLWGLQAKGIRVLIDAGAQILEMDNRSLVQAWLHIEHKAPAALYFDSQNRPQILYRRGTQLPLLASLYADDLSDCLVYLDEAHTRGTDLKLPRLTQGALTLGMGQTKDHTVQAAMRLRQLATSQSVVFFAPPEVHQSILDVRGKDAKDRLDSFDVIVWLLQQTCIGLEQLQPLHHAQGVDFCHRILAILSNPHILSDRHQRDEVLSVLMQREHQTLEQLYKPVTTTETSSSSTVFDSELQVFMKELGRRRRGFQDTGEAVQASALQEVQQEREVAYEVEAVKEVQKPNHYAPLEFPGLHQDIQTFADTGRLGVGSGDGYELAFAALQRTTLGQKYHISPQGRESKLFVSKVFMRTVRMTGGKEDTNFMRPVSWILWSELTKTALIIIPEEAELLIPQMRTIKNPHTYLLTYAAPVVRTMTHFDKLTYYTIPKVPVGWSSPTWLRIELGIFAGRLYFDFEDYAPLCDYLGLEISDGSVDLDQGAKANDLQGNRFADKPADFLREWLAARRKGQDFTHTPMGYLCNGRQLTADHPFFNAGFADTETKVSTGEMYAMWKAKQGQEEDKAQVSDEEEEEEGPGDDQLAGEDVKVYDWSDDEEDEVEPDVEHATEESDKEAASIGEHNAEDNEKEDDVEDDEAEYSDEESTTDGDSDVSIIL